MAQAINQREKTRIRNLQYDRENEVSKIFIVSLRLIERAEKKLFPNLSDRTVKYGLQN